MDNDEKILALKDAADAYDDANENDYATDSFPKYQGMRPDEICNAMMRIIRA